MKSKDEIYMYLVWGTIAIILLVAIYFLARWSTLAGSIAIGFGVWIWLFLTPPKGDSDPAGNGMQSGFDSILHIVKSVGLAFVFSYCMKHYAPDTVLLVTMLLLGVYFIKRLVCADLA